MQKTFQDIGIIFSDLSRLSDKYWKSERTLNNKKVPNDTWEHYYNLMSLRLPMTDEKIRSYFKINANRCELNFNNLFLPPLENNPKFVPILSMKCDLKNDNKISLRVEMLQYDENRDLIGFGYRFESPHPTGNHNYWHIQAMTENNDMKFGCPEWLPVNDPCIPVGIKSPIGLILFMLICFYGRRGVEFIETMDIDKIYKEPVYQILSK